MSPRERLARVAYLALLHAAVPIAGPWFALRGLLTGKYLRILPERLGWRGPDLSRVAGGVWVHAVSVGEVLAARTLLRGLRERGQGPLLLSSTTAAGLGLADAALRAGEVDGVLASPLDFPGAVRRALARTRARALVLIEAEMWPTWLGQAAAAGMPVALVNARITERSRSRYALARALFRPLFAGLAAVAARTEEDAARVRELGAEASRVVVTGDLKFDCPLPALDRSRARAAFALPADGPVLVAGSVHEAEAGAVLAAFRRLSAEHPGACLVLAPRRSFAVPAEAEGLRVGRRSAGESCPPGGVLLLDTLGELRDAYAAGDLAFVGGSLVERGGHNLLEPAAASVPVLFGPSVANFEVPARALVAHGGGFAVADAERLADAVVDLMRDPARREAAGARARAVVEAGRGALARTLDLLQPLLARPVAGVKPGGASPRP